MPAQYPNIEYNEDFGFRFNEELYFKVLDAKKYWVPPIKKRYLSVRTINANQQINQLNLFENEN